MAHRFDTSDKDPYSEAAHSVEEYVFSTRFGENAGASEQLFGTMANAVVTALGDVAEQAFKLGVNQPEQVKGLAQAVAHVAETVLTSYQGEVDPNPVLDAVATDPRVASLNKVDAEQLQREIEKTRTLENLMINGRRLPNLLDFAGSLGLQEHEDALDNAQLLVPGRVPTGPGAEQGIGMPE